MAQSWISPSRISSHSQPQRAVFITLFVVFLSLSVTCAFPLSSRYVPSQWVENVKFVYSAYCPPASVAPRYDCYWCNKTQASYSHVWASGPVGEDNYVIMAIRNETELVVAFRGTSDFRNALSDLNLGMTTFPFKPPQTLQKSKLRPNSALSPMVHKGFLGCVDSLYDQVTERLESLAESLGDQLTQMSILGHSLGAGMSVIYAARLACQTRSPVLRRLIFEDQATLIWTIGSPRQGNDDFVKLFLSIYPAANISRLVNQRDFVPSTPWRWKWLGGYHQVPTEYWFPNDTVHFQRCDGSGEDPSCSDSIGHRTSLLEHFTYLGYHLGGDDDECVHFIE